MSVFLKYVNSLVIKSHFFGNGGKGVACDILPVAGRRGSEGLDCSLGCFSAIRDAEGICSALAEAAIRYSF